MERQRLHILGVNAHPHDFTHYAGTIGIHKAMGDEVTVVTMTSGSNTHNEKLAPHLEDWSSTRQMQLFHTYLERGQMRTDDLITSRHAPSEVPEVYANLLENRAETIGVVFDWSKLE